MTKRSSAAKKPAAAKPAEARQANEMTEIAAAPDAPDAEPDGAPQVTGDGTGEPSADGEPSAEGVDSDAGLRQAQDDREEQPEETAQPPAAGQFTPAFIVSGPAKGFRRCGFTFDREPRELTPADFGVEFEGAEMELGQKMRLLAILEEPRLTCIVREPDGAEVPLDAMVIESLRAAIAKQAADA